MGGKKVGRSDSACAQSPSPSRRTASPNAIAPHAGNVQFLGEMPWEAGRLRSSPTTGYMIEEGVEVNPRDGTVIAPAPHAHGRAGQSVKRYCAKSIAKG